MRNSIHSDVGRSLPQRDRKVFRTALLLGAALCLSLSALHVELHAASVTELVMDGGRWIAQPLMLTVRRRTAW